MATGTVGEVVKLCGKLGIIGFGGPASHIAMLEDEAVARRKWLSREHFLDLVGATNLIPGPNSTEMMIHIGYQRAGWPGLIAAGISFVLPAVLLSTLIAWVYVKFGALPAVQTVPGRREAGGPGGHPRRPLAAGPDGLKAPRRQPTHASPSPLSGSRSQSQSTSARR